MGHFQGQRKGCSDLGVRTDDWLLWVITTKHVRIDIDISEVSPQ